MDNLRERTAEALQQLYRIDGEIGRGGMSVVYRAHDLRLNRAVAIKVLPPELAHDAAVGSRFTREAQTSAQLSHANIVPIFDVGERDGIAYFVMAFVSGGNLATRLEHHAVRPIDEVRRTLTEVADALAYAHAAGVVHRDIKADNILIDADGGRAMVTDFGIARAMEQGSRLTQTGVAVGTPTYMSPEQAVGDRDIDGRTDVYSLGVVGYQMLTGRVPFSAGNSMALLLKHVSERPRPIHELRPETPAALADAIERAMAKLASDRPTAAAFRDMLTSTAMPTWRAESRDVVRYPSPIPRRSARRTTPAGVKTAEPLRSGELELEPAHLTTLTPEQRADLRLWHGRVHLLERVSFARHYALYTVGMSILGIIGFAAGVDEIPPLVLSPIVPIVMWVKLYRRGLSLRENGLELRRVFTKLHAKSVLPSTNAPSEKKLEKLVTRAVLDGPHGTLVRRAATDRAAITDLVAAMPRADRALIPDVKPTVDGLFDRVVALAQRVHAMDGDLDASLLAQVNERVASIGDASSSDAQRQAALVQRQRASLRQLEERRTTLIKQMENAAIALGNLRLDLIQIRASGLEASLRDVSMATEEARVLSRDIAHVLEAASDLREM